VLVILQTLMAYKRKRSSMPSWGGKKRRTTRYKRYGNKGRRTGRRTLAYSSRSTVPANAFKPQGRKLSTRRWRNVLWRDTLAMQHYRTVLSNAITAVTPAGIITQNINFTNALDQAANNEFWKIGGGMQDSGLSFIPLWAQPLAAGIPELVNLVIRGGRLFVIIANPGLTDTIRVRVQLCFAKQQQKNSTDTVISNTFQDWAVTVTTGPRPISWSIVDAPDYSEYLYPPVMDKSIDLKPGDDATMIHKLRVKKIDCDQFRRGAGWFPYWFISSSQTVDNTGGGQPFNVIIGHNMSFAVTDSNVG